MFKKLLATVCALTCCLGDPMPASAGTHQDIITFINIIKETGTKFSINPNSFDKLCEGKDGYYQYIENVSDVLVVCSDQVNIKDPHDFWETLSHEATHVMQACRGGNIFSESYMPRIFRTLQTKAPHYARMIDTQYSTDHARHEAEAFLQVISPWEREHLLLNV